MFNVSKIAPALTRNDANQIGLFPQPPKRSGAWRHIAELGQEERGGEEEEEEETDRKKKEGTCARLDLDLDLERACTTATSACLDSTIGANLEPRAPGARRLHYLVRAASRDESGRNPYCLVSTGTA